MFILFIFAFYVNLGLACRCVLAPSLYRDVMKSSDVVIANILSSNGVTDGTVSWNTQVLTTVSGCINSSSIIAVTTSTSSASCGVQLDLGGSYFLSGRYFASSNSLKIQSCNFNRLFSTLSSDEKTFAYNHFNNCSKACARGNVVNCFVRPCATSKCNVSNAICMDNYCNGCNAYWFLGFDRVCL